MWTSLHPVVLAHFITLPLLVRGLLLEHSGAEWNVTVEETRLILQVKCPVGFWCGMGLNPTRPAMNGAELFTFGHHHITETPVHVCEWLHAAYGEQPPCFNASGPNCTSVTTPSPSEVESFPECDAHNLSNIPCRPTVLQRHFCFNDGNFDGGPYQAFGYLLSFGQAKGGELLTPYTLDESQDLYGYEISYEDDFYYGKAYRDLITSDPNDMEIRPSDAYYILLATGPHAKARVSYHGDSENLNSICASSLTAGTSNCLPAGQWKGQGESVDFNSSYFDLYEVVSDVDPHYRIGYTINHAEEYVDMLIAAKTTGWIGVGFYNQTASHPMNRADIVLAWVVDGEATIGDFFAFSIEQPRRDTDLDGGGDQLLNKAGIEENGITYAFFRRSFKSEDLDEWDFRFTSDIQTIPLVYAYGDQDQDIPEYHSLRRGYAAIQWNITCQDNTKYSIAMASCIPCEPGYFRLAGQAGFSATECQRCPVGTYAELPGDLRGPGACTPCGFEHAMTSFPGASSQEDCSCMAGYYHLCGERTRFACPAASKMGANVSSVDLSAFCLPCPSSMTCDGGLVWAEQNNGMVMGLEAFHVQPQVDIGHYSRVGEYSVFRCLGVEERCPGGEPGTCEAGREGLQCSACLDGMEPGPNGTCRECSAFAEGRFLTAVVLCFFGLLILYFLVSRESALTPTNSSLLVAITGSQAVTSSQLLGAISLFAIDWPEPLKSIFNVLRAFSFDVSSLGLTCFVATSGMSGYLQSIALVLCLILAMIVLHFVIRLVSLMLPSKYKMMPKSNSTSHSMGPSSPTSPTSTPTPSEALWRSRGSKGSRTSSQLSVFVSESKLYVLVNVLGTLGMILFISITTSVTAPFACIQHPNGLWTVRRFPSILCWGGEGSTEHAAMLVAATVASGFPLTFLAMCIYMLIVLPSKISSGEMSFLKASAFLTLRFAHGKHYFGLVFLARNFFMSLLPTIPRAVVQIACGNFLLVSYLVLVARVLPWRLPLANILDVCIMFILVMVLSVMSTLVEDVSIQDVAFVICAFLVLILTALCGTIGYLAFRFFQRMMYKPFSFFLCHHKVGAGAFARLLKLKLLDGGKLKGDVFIDSDNLSNLHGLFDHLRRETHTLVLLCTSQLYYRPWCVGEMVTAVENGLPIVKVLFPDAPHIDQAFLSKWEGNVPDKTVLREASMATSQILRVLTRVGSVSYPSITLPYEGAVTNGGLLALVKKLTTSDYSPMDSVPDDMPEELTSVIVVDTTNQESLATGHVISTLLRPHFLHTPKDTPFVLPADCELPATVQVVVLVCTRGIFGNMDVLHAVQVMGNEHMKVLPVVVDSTFQYPTTESLLSAGIVQQFCNSDKEATNDLVLLIEMIFKEIAVQLNAHASKKDLVEVCQTIHQRLTSNRLRRIRDGAQRTHDTSDALGTARASTKSLADSNGSPQVSPRQDYKKADPVMNIDTSRSVSINGGSQPTQELAKPSALARGETPNFLSGLQATPKNVPLPLPLASQRRPSWEADNKMEEVDFEIQMGEAVHIHVGKERWLMMV